MEPGRRVPSWVPWVLRLILKEALDHAGVAAALADADHIDLLAGLEQLGVDLSANLELGQLLLGDAAFLQIALGRHTGLVEMAEARLLEGHPAALSEAQLEGGVAVLLRGLLLDDRIRARLEDGHRDTLSALREDPRHADLAA